MKMKNLCPLCSSRKPKRECLVHGEVCDACCGINRGEKCGGCDYNPLKNIKVLQLKIVLQGIDPPVWRRILVEDTISFYQLHDVIQSVMGWEDDHLFEFDQGGLSIGRAHEDFMGEVKSAKKVKIKEVFSTEGQRLPYIYDFGDSWEHLIIVEKIMEKDPSQKYPVCLDGERACPPEDCGGVWGYEELLEIKKDKNHPEYEERIVEWLGEDFDPEDFDLNEVNEGL